MGAAAEDGERDPVTERGPRGLGLVGRVRGDQFSFAAAEGHAEDLEEPVVGAVDVGRLARP